MANLKQIEAFLKKKKLEFKVIDLGGEVSTVEGVTKTGVDEGEIVKTLIVRTNEHFVALAVRGKDRVDFKRVRRLFGSKSELAKPDEVQKITGVPVGAVCPILIDIPLYFDQKVLNLKHVHMGSGDLTKGLELEISDLLKAAGKYQVEDLVGD
ncbi:hypothetical protein A2165_04290 [Candidatus Curtissbacteria bacterium RBG_13_40_7]|uniref:YbaK/aminoacyl-tRNA synthetase-associated domain-containing protein n=1 Tax=Candidatus Curtissbacteria bacterium RBG_13_40_7 TaxID=1797706 RepID=A0A1F5FUV6_9BACT|nr:MAG: hypothetical protein A2165_04290 [Candidatus Curtissbacteria bacterium RBG_13_40_7]